MLVLGREASHGILARHLLCEGFLVEALERAPAIIQRFRALAHLPPSLLGVAAHLVVQGLGF